VADADPTDVLRDKLIDALDASARALENFARNQSQLLDLFATQSRLRPADQPAPPAPKRRRPQIEEWRTYAGFRANMQRREQETPAPHTKERLGNQTGGDTPKTIERTMRDYGLGARAWPPSTWPEEQPLAMPKPRRRPTTHLTMLALAIYAWLLADYASDGRLDGVVRVVTHLCKHLLSP
jgi:hypothetical protein